MRLEDLEPIYARFGLSYASFGAEYGFSCDRFGVKLGEKFGLSYDRFGAEFGFSCDRSEEEYLKRP